MFGLKLEGKSEGMFSLTSLQEGLVFMTVLVEQRTHAHNDPLTPTDAPHTLNAMPSQ